ncbi:MAG: IS1 family transposase [Acidobacteria bacterium]|nr:IS1 family transposase [Acidobacteriota bacterium]
MNRLDTAARTRVISCLLEGCSIRATVRMTEVSKKAVSRLLVDAGRVCGDYQDEVFRNLRCRRLQLDELWGFNYCKQKNVTPEIAKKVPGAGDVWLWTALDADTKLVPSWLLGDRSLGTACAFVDDLASRLSGRVQVTSDGLRAYVEAIEGAFGSDVDYTVLQKLYGSAGEEEERRYSPARVRGIHLEVIKGRPDPQHISTSYVERHNWTMRTRLSNGFSRKIENHAAAVALTYFAYNFIKIHRTLRVAPAMAAGVTDRLWEVSDIVELLQRAESKKAA